jgi:hypothetical protein
LLAFAPVSSAEDSDDVFTIRESHRHHPAIDQAEAVVPLFARTVGEILRDDTLRISESELGFRE